MPASPPTMRTYSKEQSGYIGELGPGNNTRLIYLQTAFSADQLDAIELIQNIEGSETWKVRDLFQRDVDQQRVDALKKYLQSPERPTFFNPLTLVLLPHNENGEIETELHMPTTSDENGDVEYHNTELPGFFQFKRNKMEGAYSTLQWNPNKIKIVAIDGQHRLKALKDWYEEENGEDQMRTWSIPVVILGLLKIEDEQAPSPINVMRTTFVDINTKAETINENRLILLNDEDIPSICVQQLVEQSHSNDQKEIGNRDPNMIPLLALSWRGNKMTDVTPLKTTEEMLGLFREYLIGDAKDEKGRELIRSRLNLEHANLQASTLEALSDPDDVTVIRNHFDDILLPAVSYLLRNFTPYKAYFDKLREMETNAYNGDPEQVEVNEYAFSWLKFGFNRGPEEKKTVITGQYNQYSGLISLEKSQISNLAQRDIGLRGIVSAYSMTKELRDTYLHETSDWLEHSHWFVEGLNKLHENGWFEEHERLDPEIQKTLTHVAYKPDSSITNYKFDDASKALGPLLALFILKENPCENIPMDVALPLCLAAIKLKVEAGLKKYLRPQIIAQGVLAIDLPGVIETRAKQEAEQYIARLTARLAM
jgi:DGQHR domain-containing protein